MLESGTGDGMVFGVLLIISSIFLTCLLRLMLDVFKSQSVVGLVGRIALALALLIPTLFIPGCVAVVATWH